MPENISSMERRDFLKTTGAIVAGAAVASGLTANAAESTTTTTTGRKVPNITIEELLQQKSAPDLQAVLGLLNRGTFMECHCLVAETLGFWVPELVPVFQKLDESLLTRPLPSVVASSVVG